MKKEIISGAVDASDKKKILEDAKKARESLSTYVTKACLIRAGVIEK